jgi:predicted enzyme related to lactoylglutathione lyase
MLKFSSILLFSENPKELTEFYKKVFDAEPAFDDHGYTGFQLGEMMIVIGPHDKVHGKNQTPERVLFNFETEDVEGDFKRIKDLGVTVIQEPYDPSGSGDMSLATFEDVDGNYFQIASPMKPPSKSN